MKRRSFLAILGMAPAAATIDAGTTLRGLSGSAEVAPQFPYYGTPAVQDAATERTAWARAIFDPDRAHTIKMLMREQLGPITVLDPDLAVKRSWSMSVKVSEQRSRLVAMRVASEVNESGWSKMRRIVGL